MSRSDIGPSGAVAGRVRAVHAAGLDKVLATGGFPDLNAETVEFILQEADRFAATELAPLNQAGDSIGVRRENGRVLTPPGWPETYARWIAGGWNGVGAPAQWGGQDLPVLLRMALQETWNAACTSFATGPMLTAGAIDALIAHGSPELQQQFLPRLVSGEWMATMNLTEPQAGSDLGALTTRAERAHDRSYRLFGQKIFITFGDHDLTNNVIHLVLARLPDAPPGTAGISMFVVPKFLSGAEGVAARPNDLAVAGIERKLGLHAAPTCTMSFGERGGGAHGWLIGEENRGLVCMFTMMNISRLNVGVQAVGVAERAYRQALAYARERRQGRASGAPRGTSSPIIEHPDIQRSLLHIKGFTAASRLICYTCAVAIDMQHHGPPDERQAWADRAALLTPIAKAFSTDAAIGVASLGIQVHGGAGYIEETGAAQHLRDARVFAIYEGTNGIQAIDLVTRKLPLASGGTASATIAEIASVAAEIERLGDPALGQTAVHLAAAAKGLEKATTFLSNSLADGRQSDALAGATPYLRLFGLALGGCLLAKAAVSSPDRVGDVALARFFAETCVVEAPALATVIVEGAPGMHQAAAELLSDTA